MMTAPIWAKPYSDLLESTQRQNESCGTQFLRSVIIKQLTPTTTRSIYHIFERLDKGARHFTGQEIRNCVYHGSFNDLLHELNLHPAWRAYLARMRPISDSAMPS